MPDFDALIRLLRGWTHNHDPHVREAVELLIEHETWIRRGDFRRACVKRNAREAWISWRKAREFAGSGSTASTSEIGRSRPGRGHRREPVQVQHHGAGQFPDDRPRGRPRARGGPVKIRLHGTGEECREMAGLLESVSLVQSVSDPYLDRGRSVLVRVYVEGVPRGGR